MITCCKYYDPEPLRLIYLSTELDWAMRARVSQSVGRYQVGTARVDAGSQYLLPPANPCCPYWNSVRGGVAKLSFYSFAAPNSKIQRHLTLNPLHVIELAWRLTLSSAPGCRDGPTVSWATYELPLLFLY